MLTFFKISVIIKYQKKGENKMKRYRFNPYLQMNYDTKHDELIMSPKVLKMWLETFKQCSDRQNQNLYEVLDYFTRKEK